MGLRDVPSDVGLVAACALLAGIGYIAWPLLTKGYSTAVNLHDRACGIVEFFTGVVDPNCRIIKLDSPPSTPPGGDLILVGDRSTGGRADFLAGLADLFLAPGTSIAAKAAAAAAATSAAATSTAAASASSAVFDILIGSAKPHTSPDLLKGVLMGIPGFGPLTTWATIASHVTSYLVSSWPSLQTYKDQVMFVEGGLEGLSGVPLSSAKVTPSAVPESTIPPEKKAQPVPPPAGTNYALPREGGHGPLICRCDQAFGHLPGYIAADEAGRNLFLVPTVEKALGLDPGKKPRLYASIWYDTRCSAYCNSLSSANSGTEFGGLFVAAGRDTPNWFNTELATHSRARATRGSPFVTPGECAFQYRGEGFEQLAGATGIFENRTGCPAGFTYVGDLNERPKPVSAGDSWLACCVRNTNSKDDL